MSEMIIEKSALKNITINIPDVYCHIIDKLIELKLIASRSEAIRIALRDYLHKDYKHFDNFNDFTGKSHLQEQREKVDKEVEILI